MKNKQKKKKTRNYHLLTKLESGKCRRETAANDVICLNCGESKQMHNFFPARKHLVKQCNVIFSQAMPGDLKRKNSRTAAPFWPQRDPIVVGSRVDASGQRSIERNLTLCFLFRARNIHVNVNCLPSSEKRERHWSTVAPENEEHLGPEN